MPKTTEKGNLTRAVRSGKLMLSTLVESYESGNIERMKASLYLVREFYDDAIAVLTPLIEAAATAESHANGENVEIRA